MNIFKRKKPEAQASDNSALAEMALKSIHDGVVITDKNGVVQFINPAAITITDCGNANSAIGLDYGLVIKLESKEGRELMPNENMLIQAMKSSQPLEAYQAAIIGVRSEKRIPVSISVLPADSMSGQRIITFRNITRELEEEGEQTEFISTASHEMRTPVATIDGYLSLALNPQTATIDERARGYLDAAEKASKHLGKLFQDLLDVTKLDDGKIRPHFEPVELVGLVNSIAEDYTVRAKESGLTFNIGSSEPGSLGSGRRMEQVVYGFVDVNFLREILDNLIENAIKYTPAGGSIYVNVRGDGDKVLINVTDTGIGISADDLTHIFQKFYRADNSDTRTIGGTGLGLYLVKQRVEVMGGKVWAESAFGEGSTFYVSLPRLTSEEYEKRMIAVRNEQMMEQAVKQIQSAPAPVLPQTPVQAPTIQPAPQTPVQAPIVQPTPQPVAQPTPQPTQAPIAPPTPQPIQTPTVRPTPQPVQSPAPVFPAPTPPNAIKPVQSINNNLNGEIK